MNFKEYYKDKGVAETYDYKRFKGIKAGIVRRLEYTYVDLLTVKASKILEIGTGTGFISKLLINKGKFYGKDVSQEMLNQTLETLKKLGKKPVKLEIADILNLNKKEKFNEVVTIRVISHFNKDDAILALKNINNVLDKEGKLIFNLENKSILRRFLRKIRNWGSTYTFQYSDKDIYDLAEKTNFKVEEIIYLDHFFIYPLHLVNKLFFNKLSNFIFNLELKLKNTRFMSSNSFIRCVK